MLHASCPQDATGGSVWGARASRAPSAPGKGQLLLLRRQCPQRALGPHGAVSSLGHHLPHYGNQESKKHKTLIISS